MKIFYSLFIKKSKIEDNIHLINHTYSFSNKNKLNYISKIPYRTNANAIASIQSSLNQIGIPVGGVGTKALLAGATPFSMKTYIDTEVFLSNIQDIFKDMNIFVSNGAKIEILEPVPIKNAQVESFFEQRFRIRLKVPSWNSTNILEMYINDKIYKRWILNRGDDLSQAFTSTVSVTTYNPKDFQIRFLAWGQSPLPNILTGYTDVLPFAITRNYKVIVENNSLQ